MHPPVLSRFRGGISISHDDYLKAWNELKNFKKKFLLKMDQYDAVISPTVQ